MLKVFKLPDLGEGLTESEIVAWHVAAGDTVELNQHIADVETAKAVVELPSPFAGVVTELHQPTGVVVHVGEPIVSFEVEGTNGNGGQAPTTSANSSKADVEPHGEAPAGREAVLVGYGAAAERGGRPQRRARPGARRTIGTGHETPSTVETIEPPAPKAARRVEPAPAERPRSTPPVRALARDLGVDLTTIDGTGADGLITRDDVLAHSTERTDQQQPEHARNGIRAGAPGQEAEAERVTRSPIKGVRKLTAAAMVQSAFTAPHATEFLTVDVTPTVELLESLKTQRSFAGAKIGILAVVAKALCIAVARNPSVNTRWDDAAGEIIQYNYVNLGIAAATPRGLLVPNIKDADAMTLVDLAVALTALTEAARAGTTSQEALSGGTISITNIGVFGIDAGTPILNPGEAAILAMGAVRRQPWEYRGEVALRSVMTLSLSFDHRLVDGEQGSKFLADIGAILANPGMVLTMV
ncbi:MAG TPA: dihydrolipoamide acetyltransferase family protein [Glaciibacter sp.]|nr:dihydrolipoamide acetyltransferase family protein [Glaciibacter sp.]